MDDRPYIADNHRECERLRALVGRLSDKQLALPVNEHWTVAGVLGHVAFWDARVVALGEKLLRGETFTPDDEEPEDVSWINDAARPLIHAIEPRAAAATALLIAERADRLVATLPPERMYPLDDASPLNPFRGPHRAEHVGEIDAALGSA